LIRAFEASGVEGAVTFLASGNVVFDSPIPTSEEKVGKEQPEEHAKLVEQCRADLESRIERELLRELGFEVPTFVRRDCEIHALLERDAFAPAQRESAPTCCVGFFRGFRDRRASIASSESSAHAVSATSRSAATDTSVDDNALDIAADAAATAALASARLELGALSSAADRFVLDARELHWCSDNPQSKPAVSIVAMQRALGMPFTFRNYGVLERLVEKLLPRPSHS
jgi:uncharacterized protein (DUF1697 family)